MKLVLFGLLLIGSVFRSYGTGSSEKEIVFRPVTLLVLDAETKQPLEGVVVTVINTLFYPQPQKFLWFYIDQINTYTYYGYRYETNTEGIIEIPEFTYLAKPTDYLYSQRIVMNLETVDKEESIDEQARRLDVLSSHYTAEYEMLFKRPQSYYKAGLILSYPEPMDVFYPSAATMPYITKVYNGHEIPSKLRRREPTNFNCDHEEFVFYLEHFINSEVSTNKSE